MGNAAAQEETCKILPRKRYDTFVKNALTSLDPRMGFPARHHHQDRIKPQILKSNSVITAFRFKVIEEKNVQDAKRIGL